MVPQRIAPAIFHNVQQNSREWDNLRLGKITSSVMSDLLQDGRASREAASETEIINREIAKALRKVLGKSADLSAITPKKKNTAPKPTFSKAGNTRIRKIVAEIMTGEHDSFANQYTEWGHAYENEAALMYSKITGLQLDSGGFFELNWLYGGSPDRLVGHDGFLEIKAKNSDNHLQYMMVTDPEVFKKEFKDEYAQCQSNAYLTGSDWCDFVSFDPRFREDAHKIHIIRLLRDQDFIDNMLIRVNLTIARISSILETLLEKKIAA